MGALDGPAPICHVAPMAGRVPVRTHTANVLVIGSGGAGLRAAIAAHQAGAEVVVVAKRPRFDPHTVLASGGINAALGTRDPEDSWQQHFADTLAEGYLLGDPRVVEIVAREAPAAVTELAEWGCDFARTEDGHLDQRFFGAHRWRRTCYAGDYSGRAILHTLAAKVAELGIAVVDEHYVAQLLIADGACFGALRVRPPRREPHGVRGRCGRAVRRRPHPLLEAQLLAP